MKKTTVVIVDDHKLIREMWTKLFAGNQQIKIAGESGTLSGAYKIIKVKKPDIVLLDINFPKGSGFDAVPRIKKFSPRTNIIALTMYNHPAYAQKMLDLGAKGYVTKNSSYKEVLKAIDKVTKGEVYVSTEIKKTLSDLATGKQKKGPDFKSLSSRELDVVKCLKRGLTSKEIGAELGITRKTVEVHRYNIFKKLKLKNISSLLNYINTTQYAFT
ncbi:MAG: response regulator [Chitinophagaceae bacterium]